MLREKLEHCKSGDDGEKTKATPLFFESFEHFKAPGLDGDIKGRYRALRATFKNYLSGKSCSGLSAYLSAEGDGDDEVIGERLMGSHVAICSDNQAALRALSSSLITSEISLYSSFSSDFAPMTNGVYSS